MLSFQAEKRKQKSFLTRIKSHHAELTIAYKPWVYTSSKGLIPQGRGVKTGIEKVLRNKL